MIEAASRAGISAKGIGRLDPRRGNGSKGAWLVQILGWSLLAVIFAEGFTPWYSVVHLC
ncbi:MAG TPA: hypothetical protein VKU77_23960 [Streptosporangiaceae bacterium]|nr:hypothetical protein [Streptosporangiaceae bacterium]